MGRPLPLRGSASVAREGKADPRTPRGKAGKLGLTVSPFGPGRPWKERSTSVGESFAPQKYPSPTPQSHRAPPVNVCVWGPVKRTEMSREELWTGSSLHVDLGMYWGSTEMETPSSTQEAPCGAGGNGASQSSPALSSPVASLPHYLPAPSRRPRNQQILGWLLLQILRVQIGGRGLVPRGGSWGTGQLIQMASPPLPTGNDFPPQERSFYLKQLPRSRGLTEGRGDPGLVTRTKLGEPIAREGPLTGLPSSPMGP